MGLIWLGADTRHRPCGLLGKIRSGTDPPYRSGPGASASTVQAASELIRSAALSGLARQEHAIGPGEWWRSIPWESVLDVALKIALKLL